MSNSLCLLQCTWKIQKGGKIKVKFLENICNTILQWYWNILWLYNMIQQWLSVTIKLIFGSLWWHCMRNCHAIVIKIASWDEEYGKTIVTLLNLELHCTKNKHCISSAEMLPGFLDLSSSEMELKSVKTCPWLHARD